MLQLLEQVQATLGMTPNFLRAMAPGTADRAGVVRLEIESIFNFHASLKVRPAAQRIGRSAASAGPGVGDFMALQASSADWWASFADAGGATHDASAGARLLQRLVRQHASPPLRSIAIENTAVTVPPFNDRFRPEAAARLQAYR